jgi:hypothetical protein
MLDTVEFSPYLAPHRFVRVTLRFVSSHSVELSAGMKSPLRFRFGS